MRHTADTLTPEEKARWLAEGQAWFDQWQADGYPFSEEDVHHAYDLVGLEQSLHLAAELKLKGDMGGAMLIADLAVEEADDIARSWEDEHGEAYHSFTDLVEFIMNDLTENGSFEDGEREGIDLANWHSPNIAPAYMLKGSLTYDLGRYEESLEWQKRSVAVNPMCAPAVMEVAECHKKLGDMESGLECARRALSVAWQIGFLAKARRTVAFCEGELGNHEACAANLVIANDYEPSPIVAGELMWLRGQGWDGQMTLERALDIAPEEVEGRAISKIAQEAMTLTVRLLQEARIHDADLLRNIATNFMMSDRDMRHIATGGGTHQMP